MLDIVPDQNKLCPSRAVSDELLESFYITYLGRIININFPFLIRTVTDKEKRIFQIIKNMDLKNHIHILKNIF